VSWFLRQRGWWIRPIWLSSRALLYDGFFRLPACIPFPRGFCGGHFWQSCPSFFVLRRTACFCTCLLPWTFRRAGGPHTLGICFCRKDPFFAYRLSCVFRHRLSTSPAGLRIFSFWWHVFGCRLLSRSAGTPLVRLSPPSYLGWCGRG
jgi:hypothetical protein